MKEAKKMNVSKGQYINSISLNSVWFIVSEFTRTQHTILPSFVWRRHVGVPPKDTNMAVWYQQQDLELN